MKFKIRPEAHDWCKTHHPGSPINEIGSAQETGGDPGERARLVSVAKRQIALRHGRFYGGSDMYFA